MSFMGYRGRCIGRLMAFLYRYSVESDHWQYGGSEIISGGKQIGTYGWLPGTDIPNNLRFTDENWKWLEEEHSSKRDKLAAYINNVMNIANPGAMSPSGVDWDFGTKNPIWPCMPSYYKRSDFNYLAPEWTEEFFKLAKITSFRHENGILKEEYERVKPIVDEKFYGFLKNVVPDGF